MRKTGYKEGVYGNIPLGCASQTGPAAERGAFFRILLCAVVMGVLLLSGCHGAEEKNAFVVPEVFDTSRDYELTFWAKNDSNVTQRRIYEKAIEDFEALYPNITVTMRLYGDYGEIYNDVITNIAPGTTPNVCVTYPDHIATYLTGQNEVVPLDELFDNAAYGLGGEALAFDGPARDEIAERFLSECRLGEKYYAIPFMRSTEACYVNKTYVEKLGYTLPEVLTWDFVWEVSQAALKKDENGLYAVNGQTVMIPCIYKSTDNMMIQLLWQKGEPYSTDMGEVRLFTDTTRDLLKDLAGHVQEGTFSTFKISGYPGNFLNAGQCIFAIDSTAGATWMGAKAPLLDIPEDKRVDFETAVMTVPQLDPDNVKMISQGPSVCIFNKDDPQVVLASWLFAQFLLTNDVQVNYAKTEGYVPVTLKAQDSPEYRDYVSRAGEDNAEHYDIKLKASALLISHVEDTFVTPVFNGSTSLRDAAGSLIENAAKSVRRKKVVDDAYLDNLFKEVTALYHLDQGDMGTSSGIKKDLGPLPAASKALLATLAVVWLLIAAYYVWTSLNKRKHGMAGQ